jgi:hypothetical protein
MKRRNGLAVAVVWLLLVPCCKTQTPSEPDRQSAPKAEEKPAPPQQKVEPAAKEAADRFLDALIRQESAEGKKTLAEIRWRQTMKFPECQGIATLSEEMFPTDASGIQGYKRLTKVAVPREGERPYVKHYILIAYRDTRGKVWKIFDLTDALDPSREAATACEEAALAGSDAITPQGCQVRCSYWLLMTGKVLEAEKALKKANELYAKNPDPDDEARYYKAQADASLEMISRMMGADL